MQQIAIINQRYATQAGFGLLEVVISAGILSLVIGASVGMMNSSLRRATFASDRATAMNLAQESLELAKAARDTTYRDAPANDTSGVFAQSWTAPFAQSSTKEGTLSAPGDSFALIYALGSDGSCCYWQASKTGASPWPGSAISNGVETLTINGQQYQREVYITLPAINYPLVSGLPVGVTESDVIRKVTVVVRWGSSITEAVSSIEYLTNWRST